MKNYFEMWMKDNGLEYGDRIRIDVTNVTEDGNCIMIFSIFESGYLRSPRINHYNSLYVTKQVLNGNLEFKKVENNDNIKSKKDDNQMTKQDLMTGDIVTLRNGNKYTVMLGVREFGDVIVSQTKTSWMRLIDYKENLKMPNYNEYDIVKVEKPKHIYASMGIKINLKDYLKEEVETIWEGDEIEKYTKIDEQDVLKLLQCEIVPLYVENSKGEKKQCLLTNDDLDRICISIMDTKTIELHEIFDYDFYIKKQEYL